ncbi:MAG TPA: YceI family protein [Acidimicrobiales bacterium]|jgi:hypothetical protein|nr:YceI family protein [Acidimicrobiales bacterium]
MTRFRFVPERSHVTIHGTSSLHPIETTSDGLEGYVDLEFGPEGEVTTTATPVGTLTFPLGRLSSGNAMEDRELYRRADIRRYPTIEGVLDAVGTPAEDGTFPVGGDVTFKGVTRHYEHLLGITAVDDGTVELTGASRFDIRDFGMEPPKVMMLKVHPEVDVQIDIVAERED